MLNEEKIKLMTKLAIYEQKGRKEDLPLSKYYRTDYLALKMINSAIIMTVGYLLLLLTILFINAEKILSDLVTMDMVSLGKKILAVYIVLFAANMIVTYFIESYKFKKSREKLNKYNGMLKDLYNMYKSEEASNRFFDENFNMEKLDTYKEDLSDGFGGVSDDKVFDD